MLDIDFSKPQGEAHRAADETARFLAYTCVRNTMLEDLHTGKAVESKTGDFSDCYVVTPYGNIPWTEVSRLDDDEMKKFMIEVVNKIYTYLAIDGLMALIKRSVFTTGWQRYNTAKLNKEEVYGAKEFIRVVKNYS